MGLVEKMTEHEADLFWRIVNCVEQASTYDWTDEQFALFVKTKVAELKTDAFENRDKVRTEFPILCHVEE